MTVLASFLNGKSRPVGRRFDGLSAPHPAQSWQVEPRQAIKVDLEAGDTVSLHATGGALVAELAALAADGDDALLSPPFS